MVFMLAGKGVETPRLQTELLLAHALKLPRMQLYMNFERVLAAPEVSELRELVRRRGKREPLQHIVGSTSFCGLELTVNKDALVPRPETEMLAERGWRFLQERARATREPQAALDLGTGTGCVAIALAANCPDLKLWAVDVSQEALDLARANAARHRLADRIQFLRADGFDGLMAPGTFDLIISNPPYVPTGEIASLQPEVRHYDPSLALDGGADGLGFYRRLATHAAGWLRPGGKIMVEFGDGQAQRISEILLQQKWIVEAIARDYTQRERILIGRRD